MVVKVLVSGAVNGAVGPLFSKVSTVNKKSGPFDILICVGSFFGPGDANDEPSADVLQYMTGEKRAPLPTYFIGGFGKGSASALAALQDSGGSSNLHYLGRAGVRDVSGLCVVFLDGTYSAAAPQEAAASSSSGSPHFSQHDVDKLRLRVESMDGDVDLLLSSEWPRGVGGGVADTLLPPELQGPGSQPACCSAQVADVAGWVKPRYHFAGGWDLHFARPPYMNKDLGAGGRATRFIGLASVPNKAKQKSLHALGLEPASKLSPEQLSQTPDGATACPYDRKPVVGAKRGLDALDGNAAGATTADWRWGGPNKSHKAAPPSLGRPGVVKDSRKTVYVKNVPFAAHEHQIEDFFAECGVVTDVRRTLNSEGRLNTWALVQFETVEGAERACQLNGTELMGRALYVDLASGGASKESFGKPAAGCWFCLSSAAADLSLVVSVADETYLCLDKGPITDFHALIMPIAHYPSLVSLPPAALAEVERYLSALRSCFAASGKEMVAFERYLSFRNQAAGNHCHINVAAIPASAASQARPTFLEAAKQAGFQPASVASSSGEARQQKLRDVVGDGEYFQFILPDGSRLVQSLGRGDRWPLNLGREVMAKLAGVPEKADWKAATRSPVEIEGMVDKCKALFKDYDIMQ